MATSWPPKSPRAALLSSPSGRRKYQKFQEPSDKLVRTPNVQRTSQHLFGKDEDISREDTDEDEDEETLQRKLAASEAKLKLKKLQQSKARLEADPLEAKAFQDETHTHPTATVLASRLRGSEGQNAKAGNQKDTVEVPISPVKKTIPSIEQRSPSRVLLGIDKGIRGDDISLQRARTTYDRTFHRTALTLERSIVSCACPLKGNIVT